MTALVHEDRATWLDARRGHIGGSDISALLGLNPWKTAYHVWADKVHGQSEDMRTLHAEHGQILEPWLLQLLERQTGLRAAPNGLTLHKHPTRPICGATLDARVDPQTIVELKVTQAREWLTGDAVWKWRQDGTPPWVQAQQQWQMAATGADECLTVVYFADLGECHPRNARDVDQWTTRRDDAVIEGLLGTAETWWAEWVTPWREWLDNPTGPSPPEPPADGTERTYQLLQHLHPLAVGSEHVALIAEPEVAEHAIAYDHARRDEKAAKARKDAARNLLAQAIGDHTDAHLPGQTKPFATWRRNARGGRQIHVPAARTPHVEEAF